MAGIELDHVTKRYPGGVPAVNDLTLDISDGSFFDPAANQLAGQDQEQAGDLAGEGESLWTASVNPHTSVRPGRAVDPAVDTSALYWFDPRSGQAIPRQPAGDRPSGA